MSWTAEVAASWVPCFLSEGDWTIPDDNFQ